MRLIRSILISSFLAFISFNLSATSLPAPIKVKLTQPNGHEFFVTTKGTFKNHWQETTSGLRVIKVNQTWFYAEPTKNSYQMKASTVPVGKATKKQKIHFASLKYPKSLTAAKTLPSLDARLHVSKPSKVSKVQNVSQQNISNLILLVNFSDVTISASDLSYSNKFFASSASVKAYYNEISYGNTIMVPATESYGTVNDGVIAITLESAHPNFGSNFDGTDSLIATVLNAADQYINLADFDSNNNDTIESTELALTFILAGYENSWGGENAKTPNVWAHAGSMESVTLDGKNIARYSMFGSINGTTEGNEFEATIGVMCHELGHLIFNLPDLYDRDDSSNGIGDWGIMASGSWSFTEGQSAGETPTHMSARMKMEAGFIEPQVVTSNSSSVTISSATSNNSFYQVWVDEYKIHEYFLLGNRRQSGFDAPLPGNGLLISHVDERVSTQNDDENHKLVDIEEADALQHLDSSANAGDEGDTFPGSANKTSFTNTTSPNSKSYSALDSGIALNNIAENGEQITLDITLSKNQNNGSIRYDENGVGGSWGYNQTEAWSATEFTNNQSTVDQIDGFDIYLTDTATINAFIYDQITDSVLGTELYSAGSFQGSKGWNRFKFSLSQSFPINSTRVLLLKIETESHGYPISIDYTGTASGKAYIDANGQGTFSSSAYDPNQAILLSNSEDGGTSDSDEDGFSDNNDAFPNDPAEWLDTDQDGIGNNADTDDDNDQIPDTYENQNGLNSLDASDANSDADNDGYTALDEYLAGTDPQDANSKPQSTTTTYGFELHTSLIGWDFDVTSDAVWNLDSSKASNGSVSLSSGTITDSQSSSVSYSANFAVGEVSFDLNTSTEESFDLLEFYIDDQLKQSWSGVTDWTNVSFAVSSGTHTLKWTYQKDSLFADNNDNVAIDNVVFPLAQPTSSSLSSIAKVDFNKDGKGDIILRDTESLEWQLILMDAGVVNSVLKPSMSSCCGWLFNGFGDFNKDGYTDVIIRNIQSGQWYIYNLNNEDIISRGYVPIESAVYIGVQAVADFNNDGYADVLLRDENTGEWTMTLLNNRTILQEFKPNMSKVLTWNIVDAKDFDGNGSDDILIRNSSSGAWYIYLYDGLDIISRGYINSMTNDTNQVVKAIADFDADNKLDVLLRDNSDNSWSLIHMNGRTPLATTTMPFSTSANWSFNAADDYNGDGYTDVTLVNKVTGQLHLYLMNQTSINQQGRININIDSTQAAQDLSH